MHHLRNQLLRISPFFFFTGNEILVWCQIRCQNKNGFILCLKTLIGCYVFNHLSFRWHGCRLYLGWIWFMHTVIYLTYFNVWKLYTEIHYFMQIANSIASIIFANFMRHIVIKKPMWPHDCYSKVIFFSFSFFLPFMLIWTDND